MAGTLVANYQYAHHAALAISWKLLKTYQNIDMGCDKWNSSLLVQYHFWLPHLLTSPVVCCHTFRISINTLFIKTF